MTNIRGTLIGVYNADGGIVGELPYWGQKLQPL